MHTIAMRRLDDLRLNLNLNLIMISLTHENREISWLNSEEEKKKKWNN